MLAEVLIYCCASLHRGVSSRHGSRCDLRQPPCSTTLLIRIPPSCITRRGFMFCAPLDHTQPRLPRRALVELPSIFNPDPSGDRHRQGVQRLGGTHHGGPAVGPNRLNAASLHVRRAKKGSPATRAGAAAELGFKCPPHISITTSRDRIVIAAWV